MKSDSPHLKLPGFSWVTSQPGKWSHGCGTDRDMEIDSHGVQQFGSLALSQRLYFFLEHSR